MPRISRVARWNGLSRVKSWSGAADFISEACGLLGVCEIENNWTCPLCFSHLDVGTIDLGVDDGWLGNFDRPAVADNPDSDAEAVTRHLRTQAAGGQAGVGGVFEPAAALDHPAEAQSIQAQSDQFLPAPLDVSCDGDGSFETSGVLRATRKPM